MAVFIGGTQVSFDFEIDDGGCDYVFIAKVNGKEIGRLELEEVGNVLWFWNVYVAEAYQRHGIGTALVECAVNCHGTIYTATHKSQNDEDTRYTSCEGAALINSCIRKRILSLDTWQDPDNPFEPNDEPFDDS